MTSPRAEREKKSREENSKISAEYKRLLDTQEKSINPHASFFNDDETFSAWQSENKAAVSLSTLKGLFHDDEWVFILCDRIASKIASQPLKVAVKTESPGGEETFEFDDDHPVNDLLRFPTDTQTYYEWMYSVVTDHTVAGNAVVWYAKRAAKLPHIPIEMIDIDIDQDTGKIRSYDIIQYGSDLAGEVPRKLHTIDPKLVAHMKRPNPSSPIYGMTPLLPGRRVVLFSRYSLEYLNNFYVRGAQPGLVLDMNDVSNEKNALRLLRSMEQAHTGRRNQRRNMVLPKGVKASNMTHSLADQQLKDFLPLNREAIINLYQMPKHELSIAETGSLGSEEWKMSLKNFWDGPLKAIMRCVELGLSRLLQQELGDDRFLKFDLSEVSVLQDDLFKKAELAEKMLQTHTLNEVRAIAYKDEPLEGGDETPGVIVSPLLPTQPTQQQTQSEQTEEADDLENQIDENREAEETKDISSEDRREKVLAKNRDSFHRFKSNNPEWWEQREETLASEAAKGFVGMEKSFVELYADQVSDAIKAVKAELRKQGFKSLRTKADKPNKAEMRRRLNRALNKESFEERWIDDTVKTLNSTVDVGYDTQLQLPFNIPNRDEVEALKRTNASERRETLTARGLKTFSRLNDATTDRILSQVEAGVAESKTIDQIAADITEKEAEISEARAQTIARTETLTAASIGQAAAMQDAATVIPGLKKMWINAGDTRVRGRPDGEYPNAKSDHWKVDGEVKDWNANFSNGLSFPRDPKGDGASVINCRCTWIMVPPGMATDLGIESTEIVE